MVRGGTSGEGRDTWKSALALGRSNRTRSIGIPHGEFRCSGTVAVGRCAGDSLLTTVTTIKAGPRWYEVTQHALLDATLVKALYVGIPGD